MKPIRSNELDFWNDFVDQKFRDKQDDINTELSQKAQEVSDKTQEAFVKKCGVEGDLKECEKLHQKYTHFKTTKKEKELELFKDYANALDIVLEKLQRLSKSRNWSYSFGSNDDMEPEDIRRKLRDCNYDEAYKVAEKKHAVYNNLKKIKESCLVSIHTGADIKDVVSTLSYEMQKAQIGLDIPNILLGLPRK